MDKIRHSFIGHQGRCFDVRYSYHGDQMLSASEDGSAKLWDTKTRKCLFTFDHDKENEALRCAFLDAQNTRICTCGSDGNAVIWSADASDTASVISEKPSYTKTLTLPHGDSQIYACETIACMPMEHVMTASENQLHLWDISGGRDTVPLRTLDFEVKAALTSSDGAEDTFGGVSRNPKRKAYVFDMKPSPDASSMLIAAALSDGTIRIVDLRCADAVACYEALSAEALSSVHATSVCWAPDGTSIVGSLGNGDVTLLDLRAGSQQAVIKQAHARSCFGAVFQKSTEQPEGSSQFATWSSDGSVRMWDSQAISGLVSRESCVQEIVMPDYPIYSASTSPHTAADELLIGGGSSNPSFLGTLVYTVSAFV